MFPKISASHHSLNNLEHMEKDNQQVVDNKRWLDVPLTSNCGLQPRTLQRSKTSIRFSCHSMLSLTA